MAVKGQSPRSMLRRSIPDVYRARGHRVNNLWLVYSVKTDRDWILQSDQQLIYWITFLEANPEVITFDLAPDPGGYLEDKEFNSVKIDAIAYFRDHHIEWHDIKAEANRREMSNTLSQKQEAAHEVGVIYRIFKDDDLRLNAKLAVRWLKALGFAAAIRGQEHFPCRTALASYFNSKKSGN
jgi:hypothetical protein